MEKHIHFNYYYPLSNEGFSTSDWFSLLAIIISILTICFTYYSVFLTKKIDVKYLKFEKLCLQNVEQIFLSIDKIFEISTNTVGNSRPIITDTITELNLFLVQINQIYKEFDMQKIFDTLDDFSDKAYVLPSNMLVSTLKGDYYAAKTKLYNDLFDFSIKKDLSEKFFNFM